MDVSDGWIDWIGIDLQCRAYSVYAYLFCLILVLSGFKLVNINGRVEMAYLLIADTIVIFYVLFTCKIWYCNIESFFYYNIES